MEPGESPETALIRELREELGIESGEPVEISRYEFTYPGKPPILLVFLRVSGWSGKIVNRIFQTIAWESPDRLNRYDFLEGDLPFLAAMKA